MSSQGAALIYHCHLHPLQAANCCRNSRFKVDKDDLMWVTDTEKYIVIIKRLL